MMLVFPSGETLDVTGLDLDKLRHLLTTIKQENRIILLNYVANTNAQLYGKFKDHLLNRRTHTTRIHSVIDKNYYVDKPIEIAKSYIGKYCKIIYRNTTELKGIILHVDDLGMRIRVGDTIKNILAKDLREINFA